MASGWPTIATEQLGGHRFAIPRNPRIKVSVKEKLPDKCCANCSHGRPLPDPANLRVMIRCKAGPPSAQQEMVVNERGQEIGKRVSATWPVLIATEECDAFAAKIGDGIN